MNRKEYLKKYYLDNKKKIDKQHAKYDLEHKEEKRKCQKQRLENTGYNCRYYIAHRKEIREQHRQYCNTKRKTNVKFNLNDRITTLIYYSLRNIKAGRHWGTLVGYTLDDLKNHLEKTLPDRYTWKDYLSGKLHIDHIIPVSVFNYTESEHIDFKRCWALSNLRLLPAKENIIKSNRLEKSFQPALAIG